MDDSRIVAWLQAARAKAEPRVRDFEWTWTKSVGFAIGFTFFIVISMAVIPSFWLYFAGAKLHWDGSSNQKVFWVLPLSAYWVKELRDAVAMGLSTGPLVTVIVVASVMQNWRRGGHP
jgi:hypothetical protein